jgi:anaerobic magnesium-protoporphyrin IX monomethyl ester cyclase
MSISRILFVEPPRKYWFVMGEYLPPPYGIIQLAAYLEKEGKEVQLEILDCNAEKVDWKNMEKRIESSNPDIIASSSLATCNTYAVAKTLETAKRIASFDREVLFGKRDYLLLSVRMFPQPWFLNRSGVSLVL